MINTVSTTGRPLRIAVAVAVVGGPLGYLVGGTLEPAAHTTGAATIAANLAADPMINAIHLIAFVAASYLLPVGAAALGYLGRVGAPRLAVTGAVLGVLGWLPFAALTALDDLPRIMAELPHRAGYPMLYDRFAYDAVMNGYLLVYVIGHLLAYPVLGIALGRARVVPRWAAWAMVASSPLIIVGFALRRQLGDNIGLALAAGSALLLLAGSIPTAIALGRRPGHRSDRVAEAAVSADAGPGVSARPGTTR